MKKWTSSKRLLVSVGAISCLTLSAAWAADSTASPPVVVSEAPIAAASPAPASGNPAPANVPYGVDDVLKLSRAQISDDIIQNYVQNSGTVYNLSPNDIVYLRNQGVSDRVVTAMLDQRKRVSEAVAQSAPPAAPAPVPTYNDLAAAAPTYDYAQAAAANVQPQPTYVQAAAPSSVYVIPYPQASAPFYSSYYSPYYGSYYGGYYGGYYGPSISLGFRFGGGWGHSSGFRGGFHSGGGFHGGSHGGFHGHR